MNAHEIYEKELRPACVDAMMQIADNLRDDGCWYPIFGDDDAEDMEKDMQIEYESRDGFWSYNDGGCELVFRGDWANLYYSGCKNPHIDARLRDMETEMHEQAAESDEYKEFLESEESEKVFASKEYADHVAWMKEHHPNETFTDDALKLDYWLTETEDGHEYEDYYLESENEYEPHIKTRIMLQGADGYKCENPITDSTELTLHFHYSFNDDWGYARDWCQGGYYGKEGFGNREKVCITLHFTIKDLDWVRKQIAEIPTKVKNTDDSVECGCHGDHIYSPTLQSIATSK